MNSTLEQEQRESRNDQDYQNDLLRRENLEMDCNADLGHPCDANDGEPCQRCAAEQSYWRDQWERYGKYEMRGKAMREQYEADVRDAYSDPTERAKRDSLLARIEEQQ